MKYIAFFSFFFLMNLSAFAQYDFEPSAAQPFGMINPNAPKELADFAPLIGLSDCISETRAPDGTWNPKINMTWTFKYIMNGMAVQDETLKEDGSHSGSIRQFNADSAAWYVHFYSSRSAPAALASWKGNKNDKGNIILYRKQKAPNGLDGFYKITFYDITEESFEWIGEWVDPDESVVYPTWKISCTKIEG